MRCANTEAINKHLKEQELRDLEDQKLESEKCDIEEEIREGKFDLMDDVIEIIREEGFIDRIAKKRVDNNE